ncbi:MAG: cytochrome (ubi)quinol oxidase subunit III [Bacilli bacterium]
MHTENHVSLPAEPEKSTLEGKNKFLGFWLFLGGETILFASLFGAYLALRGEHNGGPGPDHLFSMTVVAIATLVLLVSSYTSVLAVMAMKNNNFRAMQTWLFVTVLLGLTFLGLEIFEFYEYYHEGLGYTTSAFSSAFYTLVGFHGGHVLFGVLWISSLIIQNMNVGRINPINAPKFYVSSLYWHFIDVVWIFIFTVVYLQGILSGKVG